MLAGFLTLARLTLPGRAVARFGPAYWRTLGCPGQSWLASWFRARMAR
jgi:hypothetical protein